VFGAPLPYTAFSQKRCGETGNRSPVTRLPCRVTPASWWCRTQSPRHRATSPSTPSCHLHIPPPCPTTSVCPCLHGAAVSHPVMSTSPATTSVHTPGPLVTSCWCHHGNALKPVLSNFLCLRRWCLFKKRNRGLCYYLPSVPAYAQVLKTEGQGACTAGRSSHKAEALRQQAHKHGFWGTAPADPDEIKIQHFLAKMNSCCIIFMSAFTFLSTAPYELVKKLWAINFPTRYFSIQFLYKYHPVHCKKGWLVYVSQGRLALHVWYLITKDCWRVWRNDSMHYVW